MSIFFSFSLFFISFVPLWISVLFIDIKSIVQNTTNLHTEEISIVCIVVGLVISFLILVIKLHRKGKTGTVHYIIKEAKEEKTITSEYLLSYILPLFAFDFTLWSDVVLFLIFIATLAFLCIKHNHFSVNIILEIFTYRYFICTVKNDDGVETIQHVISRRKLIGCVGDDISLKSLNNEYKLDVVSKENQK